ncbi:hypothetical protein AAMO2058_001413500 [Amorphochlora amoebiformis]
MIPSISFCSPLLRTPSSKSFFMTYKLSLCFTGRGHVQILRAENFLDFLQELAYEELIWRVRVPISLFKYLRIGEQQK